MKTNIEETILFLKRNDILITELIIKGTKFETKQLEALHYLLQGFNDKSEEVKLFFKYKTSRRIALIVLLEENFFNVDEYSKIDLNKYEKKARQRFSIGQSSKNDLDTPTKIHPKNPCKYFKDDGMSFKKRHYKDALKKILETPFHFFEKEEPINSLTKTLNKFHLDDC